MQDSDENEVVSSSSSTSNSGNSESQECVPAGKPVSLHGKIWLEMDHALVVNVDWRGRNFAGTLIKVDDTNVWAPQRLHNNPSELRYKAKKKSDSFCENRRGRGTRQRGLYSRMYPRSFVDSSNIVENKLRYGRDKKVASYSSCPSSPRSSRSRTGILNVGDLRTSTPIKRSNSFSLQKDITTSKSSTHSENSDQQNDERNCDGLTETQCDEVGSTRLGENPVEEFGCETSLEDEAEDGLMPSLLRMDIYAGNSEKSSGDCSSDVFLVCPEDTSTVPSLEQYKTKICHMDEIRDNAGDEGGQLLIPTCSYYSKAEHAPAVVTKPASWEPCKDSSEKTYTTLENCDFSFLQFPYPTDTNELSMSSAQLSSSPLKSDED